MTIAAGLALVAGFWKALGGFTRLLAALFLLAYGVQMLWASISSRRTRFRE